MDLTLPHGTSSVSLCAPEGGNCTYDSVLQTVLIFCTIYSDAHQQNLQLLPKETPFSTVISLVNGRERIKITKVAK